MLLPPKVVICSTGLLKHQGCGSGWIFTPSRIRPQRKSGSDPRKMTRIRIRYSTRLSGFGSDLTSPFFTFRYIKKYIKFIYWYQWLNIARFQRASNFEYSDWVSIRHFFHLWRSDQNTRILPDPDPSTLVTRHFYRHYVHWEFRDKISRRHY